MTWKLGLYKGYVDNKRVILGLYGVMENKMETTGIIVVIFGDNGNEHGNYDNGLYRFRVRSRMGLCLITVPKMAIR